MQSTLSSRIADSWLRDDDWERVKPISIAGGGLAGLALGIGLRREGVPVSVWEAGNYPRHRVCGEFISGRGQEVLEGLGLQGKLLGAGMRLAQTSAFYGAGVQVKPRPLPWPAYCLSRYVMDALLAGEFQRLGGDLIVKQRWQRSCEEGVVRASGRRVVPVVEGWRWFGLKAHASKVSLEADLELHVLKGGYVGLCQLAGEVVNVCGLLRSRAPISDLAQTWSQWLRGPPGSSLNARLADAEFDEDSFCSVAGLYLAPCRASDREECLIGDALTMIAPLTGNGMSMAFESASLAIGPLAAYSRGDLGWGQARKQVAQGCDRAFAARLRWSRILQWALFQPVMTWALLRLIACLPPLRGALFWRTR